MIKLPEIVLRAPEPADIDLIYQWENDSSQWLTSMMPVHVSRHRIWEYVTNFDGDMSVWQQLRLIVCDGVCDNKIVGAVDLFDMDMRASRSFLGIYISPEFRGMGYGKAALLSLEQYCSKWMSLHQLVAITAEDNTVAKEMFKSAGYARTGNLRDWIRVGGEYKDAVFLQKVL